MDSRELDALKSKRLNEMKGYVREIEKKSENAARLYEEIFDGTASPKKAIKAMCQQCFGYEDYINGIRDCTSNCCPLHFYRPYQPEDPNKPKGEQPEHLRKALEARRAGK